MKIIFINILMGMYRGGGENFDLNLSRELASKGYRIEFYYLRPITAPAKLSLPEYCVSHPIRAPWFYFWTQRLHGIPIVGSFRGLRGLPRILGQAVFELHAFLRLWKRRREDFVVQICGLSLLSMLITKVLKKKAFLRFPGPPSYCFERWCMRNSYAVVANGDAYNQISKLTLGKARLLRLEIGVNRGVFDGQRDSTKARESVGIPSEGLVVLSVARFIPVKNLALLMKSMSAVFTLRKDVYLVVVGDGPQRRLLQQQVRALGFETRIYFVGEKSSAEVANYYASADIFVLSSHYDNFPNVILEAMASGLPVVATAVGGVPAQVEHGVTGLLVPPNDAERMAGAILTLLADQKMRQDMGVKAVHAIHNRFHWSRTAEIFIREVKLGTV